MRGKKGTAWKGGGRVICKLCWWYLWGLASLKTPCLRLYFVSSEGLQGAFLLYGKRSRSSGSALSSDSGPVHSPGEKLLCLHDWPSTARKLGDSTQHLHFSLISTMTSKRCQTKSCKIVANTMLRLWFPIQMKKMHSYLAHEYCTQTTR